MCFGVVGVFGVVCEFNVFKMICMSLIKILFCVKRGENYSHFSFIHLQNQSKRNSFIHLYHLMKDCTVHSL